MSRKWRQCSGWGENSIQKSYTYGLPSAPSSLENQQQRVRVRMRVPAGGACRRQRVNYGARLAELSCAIRQPKVCWGSHPESLSCNHFISKINGH